MMYRDHDGVGAIAGVLFLLLFGGALAALVVGLMMLFRRGRPGFAAAHHLAHVVAGAERRIGTGDDEAAGRRLPDRSLEGGVEPVGQSVARLGSVERDDADVVDLVVAQPGRIVERVGDPAAISRRCHRLRRVGHRRAPMNMLLRAS